MEIEIKKVIVSYLSYDVTVEECKFTPTWDYQADGSVLIRLQAVHASGATIPLRMHLDGDEGLHIVELDLNVKH